MRLLISIGMVIIFLSAFFIMFTIDSMLKNDMSCETAEGGKVVCGLENMGLAFIIKIFIVGIFILVDILTVYLIVTNVMPGSAYFLRRGEGEL